MDTEQAIQIVKEKWDDDGACASCGWHGLISEYHLEADIVINETKRRIELPCLSGDDEDSYSHRGVRIYYTDENEGD